jgi:hypothetical protein
MNPRNSRGGGLTWIRAQGDIEQAVGIGLDTAVTGNDSVEASAGPRRHPSAPCVLGPRTFSGRRQNDDL